ncbi:hypothetical protein O9G_004992 [Rozella allomycis CSF55]|uniref:Uncharacterized protein n=1 Tax=Rozella allomycis (strain CSF55) TaxID=988480 RepID=A0A075AV68_ROZAC|nr:hypothetical protein O9G_004992 [Rozella allomycis CSF55]|eukprot:EPZ34055.1 hypothetical protein O9G_004992 [Rozella allomycis CSF55]
MLPSQVVQSKIGTSITCVRKLGSHKRGILCTKCLVPAVSQIDYEIVVTFNNVVSNRFEAKDLNDGCHFALMYVAWSSGAVKDREFNH